MKKLLLFLLLSVETAIAQSPTAFRLEAETGVSTLTMPGPYRSGWHVRQQLTGYVLPRLGVALGVGWGRSSNTDPLATINPGSLPGYPYQPDPTKLGAFYVRQERMADVSVVVLPILTRRHQMKVQLGLSAYRRKEVGVDSIIRENPRYGNYVVTGKFIDSRRLVPLAGIGYDFRVSNRWAVGINGTAYFTGHDQPVTTVGLRGTYRFSVVADSLGMQVLDWGALRYGVRVGGAYVNSNGHSSAEVYRLRFNGGLWAELPLSLSWSMRGEINYAQRGYKQLEQPTSFGRYVAGYANMNYLELPILFRHEVAYRWHLYAGPYLAFFLHGKGESDGKPISVRRDTGSGLAIGATYAINRQLFADLRYARDIIYLSSRPYGGTHSFQATLGWSFQKAN
jgi:hypothetical protein